MLWARPETLRACAHGQHPNRVRLLLRGVAQAAASAIGVPHKLETQSGFVRARRRTIRIISPLWNGEGRPIGEASTSQPSRQGAPERHRRDHFSIAIPDAENLSRHILVLHDAVRNEVPCSCDRLRDGSLAVGKVDPLQVLHNLIAVENVEIKAGHGLKPYSPGKGSRPSWKMPRFSVM